MWVIKEDMRPSLHFSFSGTSLRGRFFLIFWEEKSHGSRPDNFSIYIRFLLVVDLGSLPTMLASSLISLLGLLISFWKKAGYLPRIWFLRETKYLAK